jgi:RNA polymerase sporulation-specific sigma factor
MTPTERVEGFLQTHKGAMINAIKKYESFIMTREELWQIAMVGVMKAAIRYQDGKGCVFSTWAINMGRWEVKKFLRDDGDIKISRATKALYLKIRKDLQSLSLEDLAQKHNVTLAEVEDCICASNPFVHIDETYGGEDDNQTLQHQLKAKADNTEDKLLLDEAMVHLTDKEKNVINLYFFSRKTQSQIAKETGYSQVQVSKHLKSALNKMKEFING